MASRSRGWCFTVNNFSEENVFAINECECKYLVYGREVGAGGTPHLQGYVEFAHPQRLAGLKKILAEAHWEPRRGTPEQAAKYCKKDGQFEEKGELPKQGRRTDLEEAVELVRSKGVEEVARELPLVFVKYHKGLEALKSMESSHRTDPPEVIWLWGASGVGKSREACQGSFYVKDGTKWWNGYNQQDRIVIDDFDGSWPLRDLLRLLDRYPYQGQTKGGYVKINSPKIYITCDRAPEEFWTGHELDQVKRRINLVLHMVFVPGTDVPAQK